MWLSLISYCYVFRVTNKPFVAGHNNYVLLYDYENVSNMSL